MYFKVNECYDDWQIVLLTTQQTSAPIYHIDDKIADDYFRNCMIV